MEPRTQNPEPRRLTPARTFEDLIVWREAHEFVLSIYRLTEAFPAAERYGLIPQLRRAAVSVPANIAEGFKKRGKADKGRFLNIAQGSVAECRYYLILTRDLGYTRVEQELGRLEEVSKQLDSYCQTILESEPLMRESDAPYEFAPHSS